MDSVEFVKNIKDHASLLVSAFDATIALYNLVGHFEGLQVINNCTEAKFMFTVEGEEDKLNQVLRMINNMEVSGYGIYHCTAWMDGKNLSIILTDVS